MNRAVSGVLSGLICLAIGGCGPTYWKAQLDRAAELQETAVSGQTSAADGNLRALWLSCNRMTVAYAERVQAVLERRVDEAKGLPGASEALSKAQTAAADARPYMDRACVLAKEAAAVLAPPVAVPVPSPAPAPIAPPLPAPATPAPTGGTPAPPPAVAVPVGAPVPPVGVSSPVVPPVPVVPVAPAVTP